MYFTRHWECVSGVFFGWGDQACFGRGEEARFGRAKKRVLAVAKTRGEAKLTKPRGFAHFELEGTHATACSQVQSATAEEGLRTISHI